jgi:hypothetical protein
VKKKFDVMKWLCKVRDKRAARQQGMSHEQILEETRAGSARFRASMARRKKAMKK